MTSRIAPIMARLPGACPFQTITDACAISTDNRANLMKLPTLDQFLDQLRARDPHQPEFMQAVKEVMNSLWPFIEQNPRYAEQGLLERLVEPERAIQFRVSWVDDQGKVQTNRGFRIQHSSA